MFGPQDFSSIPYLYNPNTCSISSNVFNIMGGGIIVLIGRVVTGLNLKTVVDKDGK
jgi:hypothetical protein